MCYSAQILAEYRKFTRIFGADLSIGDYVRLFTRWCEAGSKIKIPKAMQAGFADAEDPQLQGLQTIIEQQRSAQITKTEQELFAQRTRLANAERALQTKPTKAATESQRIATAKIAQGLERLADLKRPELVDRDSRIFPGVYAPVLIVENGQRLIVPMRYQCRPAGKPAFYDTKFPGTNNARRDNLRGFWKGQFGHTHGIMVVNAFYENVDREGKNVVLEFRPQPAHDMLVACLWSRWQGPDGEELLSFAAITDEPPPEVAAAGHDRCIVPIRLEHLDTWLQPQGHDLDTLDAILEDRDRPYYEHRLAA